MPRAAGGAEEVQRARIPEAGELIGVIQQRLGNKKMQVLCSDGRLRMTRVPGSKRRLWLREGDYVLVEPWSIQGESKGDIIHRYSLAEVEWLRRNGHLEGFQ